MFNYKEWKMYDCNLVRIISRHCLPQYLCVAFLFLIWLVNFFFPAYALFLNSRLFFRGFFFFRLFALPTLHLIICLQIY